MKQNNTTTKSGIGFVGLLTIAFIVLKLIGVITWSWVWVLSPLWISFIAYVAIVLAVVIWAFSSARKK